MKVFFKGYFPSDVDINVAKGLPKKSVFVSHIRFENELVFVSHIRFENELVFDCLSTDNCSLKCRTNPTTRFTFYEGKNSKDT